MTIVLILLFAALIMVFLQRKKSPGWAVPASYALVVLLFILSGARLFCPRGRPPSHARMVTLSQQFNRAAIHRLGQVAAEDIPAGASLLVVHHGEAAAGAQIDLEGMLEALEEGLGTGYTLRATGPTLVETEDGFFVTAPMLARFLGNHGPVEGIISLIGTPHIRTGADAGAWPPIYSLGGRNERHLPALLARGVVKAAALPRLHGVDWDAQPPRGASPEEWFHMRFELVRTPEEAQAVLFPEEE